MKDIINRAILLLFCAVVFLLTGSSLAQQDRNDTDQPVQLRDKVESFLEEHSLELNGFWEARTGYRVLNDRYEKDISVMETRLQLDISTYTDWAEFKFKGDTFGCLVTEGGHFDMREAYMSLTPLDFLDTKVGRQILTWGTGDLLFINDMFPKDWQSFFIGRDTEYLKAPSDAAKISLFGDWANLDLVYTPKFDHDRFISGRRLSFFNSTLNRLSGQDAIINTDKPNRWFRDDEISVRLYRNINNYELAFYGYHGFWKSPAGMNNRGEAIFPDLNVYGSSIRGSIGKGIGNMEFGYYQSADNESGNDPMINNSELRFLAGYSQEIAKEFTAGLQYYIERMMNYENYRDNLPTGFSARDINRHLITLRLTKLLLNQNLRCGLFTYFSPTDKDVYIRPNVLYKISDNLMVEGGANIFFGDYQHTFFGQFHRNSNIYTAIRYSF